MLEPSDYRSWLKPGMHEPWVPSQDEIQWEEKSAEANASQDETDPAELRDCDVGDSDMA